MRSILLILLLICALCVQAQQVPEVDIQHVHTLMDTQLEFDKNQTSVSHTFTLEGRTNKCFVISERVKAHCHKISDYSYDQALILHFISRTTYSLTHKQVVWKQTKQHKARKALESSIDIIDILPTVTVFNNRTYVVTKFAYKENSIYSGFFAAKALIVKEASTSLQIDTQRIHIETNHIVPFELRIASDSSYLYAFSKDLLKEAHKHDYRFGMRFFNEDLKAYRYLPLGFSYGFYALENHVLYLSPGDQLKYDARFDTRISLILNVYNLTTRENRQLQMPDMRYDFKHAIHFNEILDLKADEVTLLLGMKCSFCKPRKQLHYKTVNIILNSNTELFSFVNDIELHRIKETKVGDQEHYQERYYNFMMTREIDHDSIFVSDVIELQRGYKWNTGTAHYHRLNNGVNYTEATPLLIGDYATKSVYMVERVFNHDDAEKHLPLIIGRDSSHYYALSNFSIPKLVNNRLTMIASQPQVLQFVEVNIPSKEVYRFNISGEFENDNDNDLFFLNPSQVVIQHKSVWCISRAAHGAHSLTQINW